MSLWERITQAVGKDLDAKVGDAPGLAEHRYDALSDDRLVFVHASVANARTARIELRGPSGASRLASNDAPVSLGRGQELRGQTVTIHAHIDGAIDQCALVVLRVEVFTSAEGAPSSEQSGNESYSVETRLGDAQTAELELRLQLG